MNLWEKLNAVIDALQSLPNALKELTATIRAERGRDHSHINTRIDWPIEIRLSETDEKKRNAEFKKQIRVQRCIAVATWSAFAAAAGYAYVAIQQWREMRIQTSQMQRQVRQDQRPWIKVSVDPDHRPNVAERSQVSARIRIQNTGKTPARELAVQTHLDVLPFSQAPVFPENLEGYKNMPGFGWGETAGIRWPEDKPDTDFEIWWFQDGWQKRLATVSDYNDWVQGRSWVAVYGEADYADIFGVQHWTRFCIAVTGTSTAFGATTTNESRSCSDYNSADNNSDPYEFITKSRWSRIWSAIWD